MSAEPSDVPAAECAWGQQVLTVQVRKAALLSVSLPRRENHDTQMLLSPSRKGFTASARSSLSHPHDGPLSLGTCAVVPQRSSSLPFSGERGIPCLKHPAVALPVVLGVHFPLPPGWEGMLACASVKLKNPETDCAWEKMHCGCH